VRAVPANDYERRFAELTVRVGLDLHAGQDVIVMAWDPEQAPVARAVAEAAYEAGARYVSVVYWDGTVKAARLRHAPEETLDFIPDWFRRLLTEAIERKAAAVTLTGDPNPEVFEGIAPARLGRDVMPQIPEVHDLVASGEVNWTVVPGPSPGWAKRLLGEPDVDRLWATLAPLLRLDADDPVQAWREHVERLDERARQLNAAALTAIRFEGPGTDLTVGIVPGAHWNAGTAETNWGAKGVVNMPTEEVYTSPDRNRVEGTVRMTRPTVLTNGAVVEGVRLRFEGGRVVEIEAEKNADALRAQMAHDEGAARLGEIALVDGSSPVGRTGIVFGDILLDENAASHIAWGQAYEDTVDELPGDRAERERLGFNHSAVHQDAMIGDRDVKVTGVRADGERMPIIDADAWVLD
jgi:aminopeptidase